MTDTPEQPRESLCTIVSRSYLGFARTLARSLLASGNRSPLHVLVVDAKRSELKIPEGLDNLRIIELDELQPAAPAEMRWYFNAFELCNTLKPFLISHVLGLGFGKVIYFDSDIYVVAPLGPIWAKLDEFPVLLSPHHLTPPDLGLRYTDECSVLDMGHLNGGFSAWREGEAARRALGWMMTRFPIYGFCNRMAGMFVDQKLLPLLPVYFPEDVHVWREPGINVAYWNVQERGITLEDGRYKIGGKAVLFFHLSGFKTHKSDYICSYLPRVANEQVIAAAPWLRTLADDYARELRANQDPSDMQPYGFDRLNGLRLFSALRQIYYRKHRLSAGDPEVILARILEFLKAIRRRFLALRRH